MTCNSDNADLPDFIEVVYRSYLGNSYDLGSTYLPFIFFVFKYLSVLTPGVSELTSREITYLDPLFPQFALLFSVLIIISYGAIAYCIHKRINDNKTKTMLLILLAISVPTFWLIERGNIIFLCVPFLLYFCLNYDSKNRRRLVALLSFAIAVSIKPYACVFSIIMLKDKMFKEITISIAMIFLINLIPLLSFGGLDTISTIFNNMISLNSETTFIDGYKMDISNTIGEIMTICGIDYTKYSTGISIIKYIFVGLIFISSLMSKTKWECTLLITLLYTMYSNISWVYLLLQLFIPIIIMSSVEYSDEDDSRISYFSISYLIIVLILIPVAFGIFHLTGINDVYGVYLIKAILLVILSIILIWKNVFVKIAEFLNSIMERPLESQNN